MTLRDLQDKIANFFSSLAGGGEPDFSFKKEEPKQDTTGFKLKIKRPFTGPTPTPTAMPTPTPTPTPLFPDLEERMRAGFLKYSGGKTLPIAPYVPQFAQAARKYPILQQHPFLMPAVSITESSGGQNVTRENNPLNWGARLQEKGLYKPGSWEESINDAITAIAGDLEARPTTQPERYRSTTYYEPFRQSGELQTFADIYEPANKDYYRTLIEALKNFQ